MQRKFQEWKRMDSVKVFSLVKELQGKFLGTGVTITNCIDALVKENYDLEKASKIIAQKLTTERKEERISFDKFTVVKEGIAYVKVSDNGDSAVIFKLACLTDFASGSKEFIEFADEIAGILLENNHVWREHQGGNFDYLALKNKVGETISSLVYRKQKVFGKTEEVRIENIGTFSQQKGCVFGYYIHANGSFASLVEVNSTQQLAQKIARHVAAFRPEFISLETISQKVLKAKESELEKKAKEVASKKRRENSLWKIIYQNYFENWKNNNFLLEQKYIENEKITVREFLGKGKEVKRFLVVSVK